MLTQAAQDLITQVQNTVSIEAASAAAMNILVIQTADLSAKIAALPAMGTMSSEDLAAIKTMAVDLQESATKLQAAIPAKPAPATPAPDTPPAPVPPAGNRL